MISGDLNSRYNNFEAIEKLCKAEISRLSEK